MYQARDGVSLEDDLALRALLPNLRPKRGRRKGYDDDNDSIDTPNKRLRGGTPSTVDGRNSPRPDPWGRVSQSPAPSYVPHFPATHATQTLSESSRSRQTPVQGHEDHLNELFASASRALSGNNGRNTVSSSSTTTIQNNPQQLQQLNSWPHSNGRSHNEYPQSAIDLHAPSNAFGSPEMNDGSRSAHPSAAASTAKSKRRGGSGVSAAWTGQFQNVAAGGPKIRGRPPQNRNVKNGPFEIWSVKESIENDRDDGQTNYYPTNMTNAGPQAAVAQMHQGNPNVTTSSQTRRLPTKKLSLTVPPQPGGNIRLATPPVLREQAKSTETTPLPRVTLNDDKSLSRSQSLISKTRERESVKERERQRTRLFADDRNRGRSSADFFNTIDEEASQNDEYDEYKHDSYDNDSRDGGAIDWKQRAYTLAKKLKQSQDELRRIKKAVLEAVM